MSRTALIALFSIAAVTACQGAAEDPAGPTGPAGTGGLGDSQGGAGGAGRGGGGGSGPRAGSGGGMAGAGPAAGGAGGTGAGSADAGDEPPLPVDAAATDPIVVDAAVADSSVVDGGAVNACPKPNVDGFTAWQSTNEGKMIPPSGSALVKEGAGWVARVEFVGGGWHVFLVYVGNTFGAQKDLSASKGFTLTYSSSAEMYIQLRSAGHWNGGAQYVTKIPATGGQRMSLFVSFAPDSWSTIGELGRPSYPYADVIKQVRGLVVVGKLANKITFYGLTIDGYHPPCP